MIGKGILIVNTRIPHLHTLFRTQVILRYTKIPKENAPAAPGKERIDKGMPNTRTQLPKEGLVTSGFE